MRRWTILLHWGPPCSDDPFSNSVVTGALVAGRAVTSPDATGITPVASVKKQDVKIAGGRSPRKKEKCISL